MGRPETRAALGLGRAGCRSVFFVFFWLILYMKYILDISWIYLGIYLDIFWDMFDISLVYSWYMFGKKIAMIQLGTAWKDLSGACLVQTFPKCNCVFIMIA